MLANEKMRLKTQGSTKKSDLHNIKRKLKATQLGSSSLGQLDTKIRGEPKLPRKRQKVMIEK